MSGKECQQCGVEDASVRDPGSCELGLVQGRRRCGSASSVIIRHNESQHPPLPVAVHLKSSTDNAIAHRPLRLE